MQLIGDINITIIEALNTVCSMKISKKALGMPPEGFVFCEVRPLAVLIAARVANQQRRGINV
ncbi:hypothetical protein ACNJYD_08705 [Bradyrhizobium sp. DASA03005]|uniref:hypothetical protein n=1 Tax=Bradyrhizobium sp. SPXBL-02 TaxID=3395912 RepID=UPI003F72AC3E